MTSNTKGRRGSSTNAAGTRLGREGRKPMRRRNLIGVLTLIDFTFSIIGGEIVFEQALIPSSKALVEDNDTSCALSTVSMTACA